MHVSTIEYVRVFVSAIAQIDGLNDTHGFLRRLGCSIWEGRLSVTGTETRLRIGGPRGATAEARKRETEGTSQPTRVVAPSSRDRGRNGLGTFRGRTRPSSSHDTDDEPTEAGCGSRVPSVSRRDVGRTYRSGPVGPLCVCLFRL